MTMEQGNFNGKRPAYETQARIEKGIRVKHATTFLGDHFGRSELGPRIEEVERLRRSFPLWKERVTRMLNPGIEDYSMHLGILKHLDYSDLRMAIVEQGVALVLAKKEARYGSEETKKIEKRLLKLTEISDIIVESSELDRDWNDDGEDTVARVSRELFSHIK